MNTSLNMKYVLVLLTAALTRASDEGARNEASGPQGLSAIAQAAQQSAHRYNQKGCPTSKLSVASSPDRSADAAAAIQAAKNKPPQPMQMNTKPMWHSSAMMSVTRWKTCPECGGSGRRGIFGPTGLGIFNHDCGTCKKNRPNHTGQVSYTENVPDVETRKREDAEYERKANMTEDDKWVEALKSQHDDVVKEEYKAQYVKVGDAMTQLADEKVFYDKHQFSFQSYLDDRTRFATAILGAADHIQQVQHDWAIAQTAAGAVNIASGLAIIGGVLLAPFSGGASLALTAAGCVGGVAAASTDIIKHIMERNKLGEIEGALKADMDQFAGKEEVTNKLFNAIHDGTKKLHLIWDGIVVAQWSTQSTKLFLQDAKFWFANGLKGTVIKNVWLSKALGRVIQARQLRGVTNLVSVPVGGVNAWVKAGRGAAVLAETGEVVIPIDSALALNGIAGPGRIALPGFLGGKVLVEAGSTTAQLLGGAFGLMDIAFGIMDIVQGAAHLQGSEIADAYRDFESEYAKVTQELPAFIGNVNRKINPRPLLDGSSVNVRSYLNTNIGVKDGVFWNSTDNTDDEKITIIRRGGDAKSAVIRDGDHVFLESHNTQTLHREMITVEVSDDSGKPVPRYYTTPHTNTSAKLLDLQTFVVTKSQMSWAASTVDGHPDGIICDTDQIYLSPLLNQAVRLGVNNDKKLVLVPTEPVRRGADQDDRRAARDDDDMVDDDYRRTYGTFSVIMADTNRIHSSDAVFLRSHLNTNIGVNAGHFWTSENQGDWETITVEKADVSDGVETLKHGDKVFLRSANPNGQYGGMITVDQDGNYGTSTARGDYQTFLVQKRVGPAQDADAIVRDGDQIYLKAFSSKGSANFTDNIGVDNSGHFEMSAADNDSSAFTIVAQLK